MSAFDDLYSDSLEQQVAKMEKRILHLERYQAELVAQNKELSAAADRFMRVSRSSLFSPNLVARAFTVYGYYLLAGFLIALPFLGCYLLVVLTVGLSAFGGGG